MRLTTLTHLAKRLPADLLIVPFWKGQKKAKPAAPLGDLEEAVRLPVQEGDFKGKEGETLIIYREGAPEKRLMLLGLGAEEQGVQDTLRRAYACAVRACSKGSVRTLNVLVPNIVELRNLSADSAIAGIAEGLTLACYKWSYKTGEEGASTLIESACLVGIHARFDGVLRTVEALAEGVYCARDLVNGNADSITPLALAEVAAELARKFPSMDLTILDKAAIEEEKMGLLLAVARGAMYDPRFIVLRYRGHARSKDHTVLVGKGVTFDTGGLNLKPTGSMETMRDDMSGAATVLATVATAASLKLRLNVTAVVPATENGIDALSFKPGDVYTSHSGKTVEIGNTDAEGRLILADALSYTVKYLKPSRIVDLATLTGAMVVALGEGVAGFFSNNDELARQLQEASDKTAEPLWRLPLFPPYKELLKSDIADLKNIGGRPAGAITAALFLQEFVDALPWAHIDIAGTAFSSKEQNYWPKNGVGFGVRLLIEWLSHFTTA